MIVNYLATVMERTDWQLLSEQKATLLKVIDLDQEIDNGRLCGLLEWIDNLQEAAEKEGYPVVWLTEEAEYTAVMDSVKR